MSTTLSALVAEQRINDRLADAAEYRRTRRARPNWPARSGRRRGGLWAIVVHVLAAAR